MAILPRKRLGPNEFPPSIGAGGIGRIYRVRNTLNREVALNPLPEVFSSHRDRTPHFEREAPALAALYHHPSRHFTAWKAIWSPRRIWPPVINNWIAD